MNALFLSLLISLVPGEREPLKVTDFVHTGVGHLFPVADEDCPPPQLCDIAPAFERAIAYSNAHAGAPAGMRPQGGELYLPPGEYRATRAIVIPREFTVRGGGGAGWGAPTVIRVETSTHGFVVSKAAAWSTISDIAVITSVDTHPPMAPVYGVYLQARTRVSNMWIRGFTVGVHAQGDLPTSGTNLNGTMLEHLRIDLSGYAGVYIAGDNAYLNLVSVDAGSNCQNGAAWASYFLGRECDGIMEYSMMGSVLVAVQSANYKPFGNFHLRRSAALGAYSENPVAPSTNELEIDAVALGGTLAAPNMATGLGLALYGPRASALRVRGVPAAGETIPPEVWMGSGQPAGGVMTFLPPQSGSAVPSYSALRFKMDTTAGKRGWKADVQNASQYTALRISVEPTKPAVMTTRTSTKVIP